MTKKQDDNYSTSPFYDVEFAKQHIRRGRLVPDTEKLCASCHMPPPAEWCWQHNPDCPLHMPLRHAETVTVRCEFSLFGMPPKPGTMTFHHGSNHAQFVSDDGNTRTWIAIAALRAMFTEVDGVDE